jgi:prepilin-type N-terminal cleavage/methylation domain-containing protein
MKKYKAFTLIELLVVVAIIAILTAVSFAGYQSIIKKGQDTKRLGDISQIRLALETYKSINGLYPDAGSGDIYVQGLAPGFMDKLPQDPTGANYIYKVSSDKKSYCLKIKNVFKASSQKDLVDLNSPNTWQVMRGPDASICSGI